jgi:hypothetical protein
MLFLYRSIQRWPNSLSTAERFIKGKPHIVDATPLIKYGRSFEIHNLRLMMTPSMPEDCRYTVTPIRLLLLFSLNIFGHFRNFAQKIWHNRIG